MRLLSRVITLGMAVLGLVCASVPAQTVGTAFTYQGELFDNGTPVEGACDFAFTLHDAVSGGNQLGGRLEFDAAPVEGGVFTVVLDFDEGMFDGHERFLEIEAVCPAGGTLEPLTPRQAVRPVPYALALPAMRIEQAGPDPIGDDCPGSSFFRGPNVIGGWHGNEVSPDVVGATIAGGGGVECLFGVIPVFPNSVEADFGTVGGGESNTASGFAATIGGGASNTTSGSAATVGGGTSNVASGSGATVGGGGGNVATLQHATVGGGALNTASGVQSTIGGGNSNIASGDVSTVSGGNGNTAGGFRSTIGGGLLNTASGSHATVPGGIRNRAGGDFSFAAGRSARVRDANQTGESGTCLFGTCGDEGTFVWADATTPVDTGFESTGPNQFLINATGGVGIGTNSPSAGLDVVGTTELNGDVTINSNLTVDADALFVDGTAGNVGIGTNSPDIARAVTIQGKEVDNIAQWISFTNSQPGTHEWHINNLDGGLNFAETGVADRRLFLQPGGNVRIAGGLFVSDVPFADRGNAQYDPGDDRFYFDNSSRRHKRDIRPLEDEFEKILEAEPKTYTRPGDPNRREIGYIAEDFADLGLDRLVYFDADGAPSAINYRKTAIYLNEVVKKQQTQLAEQKDTVAAQATRLANLSARMARMEAMMVKLAEPGKGVVK